jgi:hypothetical protein
MAAPFPPQGNQKQQNEKPLKVYAEQYVIGQPLPIGATTDFGDPPMFVDGLPRVALETGWVVVELTDWVISSRYTGKPIEVISAEEFAERFGPSNLAEGGV